MIDKLRSAGLGFYVRETETQQKLGTPPNLLCYASSECVCGSLIHCIPQPQPECSVIVVFPDLSQQARSR